MWEDDPSGNVYAAAHPYIMKITKNKEQYDFSSLIC
jgi:hypothetical protein